MLAQVGAADGERHGPGQGQIGGSDVEKAPKALVMVWARPTSDAPNDGLSPPKYAAGRHDGLTVVVERQHTKWGKFVKRSHFTQILA